MNFEKDLAASISKALKLKDFGPEKVLALIETPPDPDFGDFAFPCFRLAKEFAKSPADIALDLNSKIELPMEFSRGQVAGAYINFFLKGEVLVEKVLDEVLSLREKYGKSALGKGKRVMVEYSAPNANKPLHLGHLRNDSIGMAISNMFEATGHEIVRANLVNDRGVHICKVMLAYKKWGNGETPQSSGQKPDHFVGKYYVMYEQKAKDNPALESEIQGMLMDWEKGGKETRELWKKMTGWAIEGMHETYKEFGSKFDVEFLESEFYNKAAPMIEGGLKKGFFSKDETGAIIADLEKYGLQKKTVLRSDGTSIYLTNDLSLTKHKFEKYRLDRAIWVVGSEQNLYLSQLFKILELLGYKWAKGCKHLSYGMVNLPSGKMKSREGTVVDADDLIGEVKALASKEILKREKGLSKSELEKRAKAIALAAMKFFLLKVECQKDILYDPKESVSFDGETGPYLLYSLARAKSILRKAGEAKKKAKPKSRPDFSQFREKSELCLARKIYDYQAAVESSLASLSPHTLCQYLLGLASSFNSFYHEHQVLEAHEDLREARLCLVEAFSLVLENGFGLLNIEWLERM